MTKKWRLLGLTAESARGYPTADEAVIGAGPEPKTHQRAPGGQLAAYQPLIGSRCGACVAIVPRGTSFHHAVELEFPSIALDPARFSCRCDFPGPAKLGAVNPDAVHNHGQPARQRHDRLFHPAAPGDLHRPGLE